MANNRGLALRPLVADAGTMARRGFGLIRATLHGLETRATGDALAFSKAAAVLRRCSQKPFSLNRSSFVSVAIALPLSVLTLACDRDKGVRTYKAPAEKDIPTVADNAGPAAEQPNAAAMDITFPGDLRWTLPAGWKQVAVPQDSSAMFRPAAIIQAGDAGSALPLTVSRLDDLPGARNVLGNVNRWAGQIELPAFSEADLSNVVTPLQVNGVTMSVVDLDNPKSRQRMLGAMCPHGHDIWVFKLLGATDSVAAQKSSFDQFLRSLRFEAGGTPSQQTNAFGPPSDANVAASDSAATGAGGAHWVLPAGWSAEPGNTFRLATVHTGNSKVEIRVSKFAGLGGGLTANVNRWRGEVGLVPVDDAQGGSGTQADLGGRKWTIRDYTGPANGGSREIVASTDAGGETWFFKMLGPAQAVAQQKADFDKYLASIRLGS